GYRLRKLARKYKKPLAAATTFAMLLLAAVVVSSWQAVRATRAEAQALAERDEKELARKDADAARQKAEDFADRLREATVMSGRAQLFTQQRRWSSAHAAFAKAEELEPGLITIYALRRWMYKDLGLWE